MSPFGARHNQFGVIHQMLTRIEANQEKIMAAQQDIDSAVQAIQAVAADLTAQVQAIAAKIGSPVDTSALGPAVTALQQAQAQVDALAQAGAAGGTTSPGA